MTVETKPSIWVRMNPFYATRKRAIWSNDDGTLEPRDLLASALTSPEQRRQLRSNADITATYGAVYAAIKRRVRAVAKPRIVLVQTVRGEEVEVEDHPALLALRRVNESLTFSQGFGMIEQHKLTHGKAYWIKRRNGLGVPVEFEIWPPDQVVVIPDKEKPWVPAAFEWRKSIGTSIFVAPEDVVWFRHLVDPRNVLNGLSPIGAVRTEIDTGIEAARFNQRYFDNALTLGTIFTAEDVSESEADRIEQELERKFRGVDRAHKAMVSTGSLKVLESKPPHKDMDFAVQQRWGVEEVARVFEMQPELLGQGSRTYENAPAAERSFWTVIQDQVDGTLDEFNEFFLTPDFGEEFRFVARYDDITALQSDLKLKAEIDEINLRVGRTSINEVRERDGEDGVEWGDVPIMPLNMVPFGSIPTIQTPGQLQTEVVGEEEPRALKPGANIRKGWESRFKRELKALTAYLMSRKLTPKDVDSYDWNWFRKYGSEVIAELKIVFLATLKAQEFADTPVAANKLATQWARAHGAELLKLNGDLSITATTKEWVKGLVSQTLEKGQSLQTLTKNLKEGMGFVPSRAEMIARTETASAQTQGTLASYESLGHEGKEWLTAGDERVDGGDPSGPCIQAENQGAIKVKNRFGNGHEGPPAHPNCRCTLLPVRELKK